MDIAYLDFSKIFDVVPHSLFLEKLEHCGLDQWWEGSLLTGHTQGAVVNSSFSNCQSITSGSPEINTGLITIDNN